jgi:hypothetical protein
MVYLVHVAMNKGSDSPKANAIGPQKQMGSGNELVKPLYCYVFVRWVNYHFVKHFMLKRVSLIKTGCFSICLRRSP